MTDPATVGGGGPLPVPPHLPRRLVYLGTPEMAVPLLSARVADNVRRWAAGEPLLGPVDPALGY